MRFLRLTFVVILAVVLVAVALANRGAVTLSAFPGNFGEFLGGRWYVEVPLFLVIFLAFAVGMLAGLVWEWLREHHIRREARTHAERASRLEDEVGHLRHRHAAPKDEVLAILEGSKTTPLSRPSVGTSTGASLPATR